MRDKRERVCEREREGLRDRGRKREGERDGGRLPPPTKQRYLTHA